MIRLHETAVAKVKELLDDEKDNERLALRIAVQGGGCSGFQYNLSFDEPSPDDLIFEENGIKIIVDPMSHRYLDGASVEFRTNGLMGGFLVSNPQASGTCGCGHSFTADGDSPAKP